MEKFLMAQCFKSLLMKAFHPDNFFNEKENKIAKYILVLVSTKFRVHMMRNQKANILILKIK